MKKKQTNFNNSFRIDEVEYMKLQEEFEKYDLLNIFSHMGFGINYFAT